MRELPHHLASSALLLPLASRPLLRSRLDSRLGLRSVTTVSPSVERLAPPRLEEALQGGSRASH